MAACGTPKPRNAPDGGELVRIARESARTFGTRYGPMQCTGTRPATVGPHDAYAPVSKSPSNSYPTMRPSGSATARARSREGWRLVVAAIDSGRV